MLGLGGSLRFPHLSWVEAVDIHTNNEKIPCYTLNWGPLDEIKCPYAVPLPEKYLWMSEGAFAIRGNYGQAIAHYAQLALIEAAKVSMFGLDTMMRETSHKVSEQAVFTAFRLLADCDYDPKTQYWSRAPERLILPYLLAWRFWQKQTGRGLLWEKAKIPELIHRMDRSNWSKKEKALIEDFLDTIRDTNKAMDEMADRVLPKGDGPVVGPKAAAIHVIEDIVVDDPVVSSTGPAALISIAPKEVALIYTPTGIREAEEHPVCVPLINPGRVPNAFPTEGSWFRVSSEKYPGCFGFFQISPSGTVPTTPAGGLKETASSSGDGYSGPLYRG